ncbi:hypothetical protein GH714_006725 [Hevea brasiliensis]|uniref:DUF7875 domain-containing protein n=1 Tax=Hevea brasiliensis TaxID=3981 RepID=A0A6A6NG45_HEVBR|nr:hypothetical protein GH714_006725 [Hevea brasiliensis]
MSSRCPNGLEQELQAFKDWQLRAGKGPRITVPRSLRWATCGAISVSSTSALLVRLFSPECEPQNIAAYDKTK